MVPGRVPWSGVSTYRGGLAALGGVALLFALGIALRGSGAGEHPQVRLVLMASVEGVLLWAAWWFGVRRHRAPAAALGFRAAGLVSQTVLPLAVLAASGAFAAVYVLVVEGLGLEALRPPDLPEVLRQQQGAMGIGMAVVVVALGPVAEETFFRGFLLQGLERRLGTTGAVVASSLLFGASHGSVGVAAPAFVSGVLLGWLFVRTRSLGPGVLAHAIQNWLALSVAR